MTVIFFDVDADGIISAAILYKALGKMAVLKPYRKKTFARELARIPVGSTVYILDKEVPSKEVAPIIKTNKLKLILIDHHLGNPLARYASVPLVLRSPSTAALVAAYTGLNRDPYWRRLVLIASAGDVMRCWTLRNSDKLLCWRILYAAEVANDHEAVEYVKRIADGDPEPPPSLLEKALSRIPDTVRAVLGARRICGDVYLVSLLDSKAHLSRPALLVLASHRYPALIVVSRHYVKVLGGDKNLLYRVAKKLSRVYGKPFGRSVKSFFSEAEIDLDRVVSTVCGGAKNQSN